MWEKKAVPKSAKTGEEICDGPDTQMRPTIISLKINYCCRAVLAHTNLRKRRRRKKLGPV